MLGLQYAGSSWLHVTNEYLVCKHCGRTREEIRSGNYKCFRKKIKFNDGDIIKSPRHPLWIDAVKEIRNCGYCQRTKWGFCKRHDDLKQFLESGDKHKNTLGVKGKWS